jgi:hypothetical protein
MVTVRAAIVKAIRTRLPRSSFTMARMIVAASPRALTLQMLAWLVERPRTYVETMDAWRTSCPRLSIWEDALADRLVCIDPADGGGGHSRSLVGLTVAGRSLLDRFGLS